MKSERIAAIAALALSAVAFAAAPKPKLKPCVEFATSWDAAIAEAKLLNLPLVVHSHGFY